MRAEIHKRQGVAINKTIIEMEVFDWKLAVNQKELHHCYFKNQDLRVAMAQFSCKEVN